MSAAATNGLPKGHVNAEMTRETMMPHIAFMVNKLQSRMIKMINVMSIINDKITERKPTSNHRIQTLRRGRVINKKRRRTQKRMEKILHSHMIFKHDVNFLLKRYTTLFKQAAHVLEYLRSESVPTPLPPQLIADANMLFELYERYNQLYRKIDEEYNSLDRMFRGNTENAENTDSSNNNAEPTPSVQFRESTVRRIPTFFNDDPNDPKDLIVMKSEPLKREGVSASMGGSRRTLRKKHLRNTRRNRI